MWVGTHNLQDNHGRPTFFAGIVLFTEAVPTRIRARLKGRLARLRGFQLLRCAKQPDLCIAYRRKVFTPEASEYHLAHKGEAGFTPHRGTYVVLGRIGDRKTALIVEHRINWAFRPGAPRRAERGTLWVRHKRLTLSILDRLHSQGYFVIAGGDLNTWPKVSGYEGALREVGHGLDRIGISKHLGHLTDVQHLDAAGSDHKRLRATLSFKKPAKP